MKALFWIPLVLMFVVACGVKKPPSPLYATPKLQETPSPTPQPGSGE